MNAALRFGRRHALHAVAARFEFQFGIRALPGNACDDFLVAAEFALAVAALLAAGPAFGQARAPILGPSKAAISQYLTEAVLNDPNGNPTPVRRWDGPIHVVLNSDSDDVAFYRDVIGFEVVLEAGVPEPNDMVNEMLAMKNVTGRAVTMRAGNTFIELIEFSSPKGRGHDVDWSLADYAKRNVLRAVSFISDFETSVVRNVKKRGYDGVICGHIHTPVIKSIEGLTYINCGDWVDSCTAIVEHFDGRMQLVRWMQPDTAEHAQIVELAKAIPP